MIRRSGIASVAAASALALVGCDGEKSTTPGSRNANVLVVSTNQDGSGYAAGFEGVPSGDLDLVSVQGVRQITAGWGSAPRHAFLSDGRPSMPSAGNAWFSDT